MYGHPLQKYKPKHARGYAQTHPQRYTRHAERNTRSCATLGSFLTTLNYHIHQHNEYFVKLTHVGQTRYIRPPASRSRSFRADISYYLDLYDLCDLRDLAHVAGWKPNNLRYLAHGSWVGSELYRSCTTSHGGRIGSINDLLIADDLSQVWK